MNKDYAGMAREIVDALVQEHEALGLTQYDFAILNNEITKALESVAKEREEEIVRITKLHADLALEVARQGNAEADSLRLRLARMEKALKNASNYICALTRKGPMGEILGEDCFQRELSPKCASCTCKKALEEDSKEEK